ncbi:DJ-1/PfpI family protein [uncultured Methanobrevibacter sp.]|uniref:nucleotide-binding protein n=1 Tax=uncultured Methanobrevibacter sp. TaxID=253161 RepID=UPI002626BB1F|nr:DJ-1/PfpI family protein [uncultured Methanobrevibacter sp.]
MKKIGITYVKGAVPGFENFGGLPTDIVKSNGLVNGVKASEELDALIIPGGTIIESDDVNDDLKKEIKKIANDGKPVIGICAGFQLLSNQTDIGRKSEVPIIKEGLGLIDINFSPLISSDRVKAKVYDNSFITKGQKEDVRGFHTHTYGKATGDAKPLFYSQIQRMNYGDVNKESEYNIFSGACNDDGNVIGTMIHNILDENPIIRDNLLNYIDTSPEDIISRNKEFRSKINKDLGIDSGYKIEKLSQEFLKYKNNGNGPKFLMIGSNGSDSGKTFILTGLAGALRRKGLKVGLLKVGPDVRDIVPGLYLTNGKMEDYSSIKIGHLGWMDIKKAVEQLNKSYYDIVLIEGVMSVFTGLLNEKVPYSASEIAMSSNIPMLLISGVNKGGIESAAVDLVAHANMLEKLGVTVEGILLNKVYNQKIFENVVPYIKNNTHVKNVLKVSKLKIKGRGFTPEVEIRYDLFSKYALECIEENIDINIIADMAKNVEFNRIVPFEEIKNKVI